MSRAIQTISDDITETASTLAANANYGSYEAEAANLQEQIEQIQEAIDSINRTSEEVSDLCSSLCTNIEGVSGCQSQFVAGEMGYYESAKIYVNDTYGVKVQDVLLQTYETLRSKMEELQQNQQEALATAETMKANYEQAQEDLNYYNQEMQTAEEEQAELLAAGSTMI